MEKTAYTIRQVGKVFICNLLDKRIQGFTQIFQSMGRTKAQAVRKMNKMLKPHGFKAVQEVRYATYYL